MNCVGEAGLFKQSKTRHDVQSNSNFLFITLTHSLAQPFTVVLKQEWHRVELVICKRTCTSYTLNLSAQASNPPESSFCSVNFDVISEFMNGSVIPFSSSRSLRWINNTSKWLASYLGIRLSSRCCSFIFGPVAAPDAFVPIMYVIVWARLPCRSLFESFQVSWAYATIVYLHLRLSHARSLVEYH